MNVLLHSMLRVSVVLGAVVCSWLALTVVAAEREAPTASDTAIVLRIADAIGPATSDFFLRALEHAEEQHARLLILELDTPGGLDSSMRAMIQALLASPVPVVIYVSPSGARAASAGTYLLYASHVAAMAPATNLGAATPIQIGGQSPARKADESSDGPEDSVEPASAAERKAVNDAVSYIRGLAELRGRNVEWAESAVRRAVSLSANAALEQNVVDVIARDIDDLLRQIDGREVSTAAGTVELKTSGLRLERFESDWRTRLLSVITNPNVAYMLMLAGVYGLLLEGYNPGAILPGVVGAISLLLALYAFQVLDVNYAGLALLGLGVALIVGEAFAPSFGALGIGGIVAFVFGSVILFDSGVPGFEVARGLVGGAALAAAVLMLLMVTMFMRARRAQVRTGTEQMLHETAIALGDFSTAGLVDIHGETWRAVSGRPVRQGQRLRVMRVQGLTLEVEPMNDDA